MCMSFIRGRQKLFCFFHLPGLHSSARQHRMQVTCQSQSPGAFRCNNGIKHTAICLMDPQQTGFQIVVQERLNRQNQPFAIAECI